MWETEWKFHPEVVKQIWSKFYEAEVNLFASQETAQCPLYFSLSHPAPLGLDAMAHTWPRMRLYAFPPVALLTGVLARVRQQGSCLLLIAPRWPNRIWISPRRLALCDSGGGTFCLKRWGQYFIPGLICGVFMFGP